MRPLALLLAALALSLAGCAATAPSPSPHSVAQDALWLDRLTWGSSPADLAAVRARGRAAWLDAQLQPPAATPLPAPVQARIDAMEITRTPLLPLVQRLEAQRRAADALADDTAKAEARKDYQQALNRLAREAAQRALLRAVHSPQQLQEQLTWFWFNHFNVHQGKANLRAMVGDYEQGLRERAVGRFRDLLGYTARHPAMLRYLDNAQNAARRPNENYARELLELHTLGADAGYTQQDVQELARVLTGLGLNLDGDPPRRRPAQQALYRRDGLVEFNPARHDFGDKQLLGLAVRGGGEAELDEVLDHLARDPRTARFVSARLAQFFVADEPPPALVARMAERWQRSDGRIADVLRTMIASPEFEASLGRKFKDPMHYVVSALRLGAGEDATLDAAPVLGWLGRLGQAPYQRQTPDGYPLDEAAWAGPGQMAARFDIARAIAQRRAAPAGAARTPAAMPDPLDNEGIAPRLSPATRQALAAATTPQERLTLWLASPEFMHR